MSTKRSGADTDTHELGDSWHGMDWDYDELHHNLGLPTGNATAANTSQQVPIPPAVELGTKWSLWNDPKYHANASWTLDANVKPSGSDAESVRVDIHHSASGGSDSAAQGIDLHLDGLTFKDGNYELTFWAKASASGSLMLNSRLDGPPWSNLGLQKTVALGTGWAEFKLPIVCPTNTSVGRLSFQVGVFPTGSSVWINGPAIVGSPGSALVLRRDFECGMVLLNGDSSPRTVHLESGFTRLKGEQAPKWQYIIDDNSSAFQTHTGQWSIGKFDSGYRMAEPSSEQVRPPNGFFHHWFEGAHIAQGLALAKFDLRIPEAGTYNLSMWWADAVPARTSWARKMDVSVVQSAADGTLETTLGSTVDLRTDGGDVWLIVAANAQLTPGAAMHVECASGVGDCVADAVLVESAARYNDGSMMTAVTLAAKDAIILAKAQPPAHC